MLNPALGRAFRASCAACASITPAASRPTAAISIQTTAQTFAVRPLHQRRHSSSKPSTPSDGNAGPTPQTPADVSTKSASKKTAGRGSRKRPALPAVNLPRVPPTDHLKRTDVDLSSFFSLHRPISVTASIPPTSTEASFNEIFQPRAQEKERYHNVIFTLAETVDALENAAQPVEADEYYGGSGFVHMEGMPSPISIDKLIAQFRPFQPPPPPVAFEEETTQKRRSVTKKATGQSTRRSQRHSPQKSWSTTITVTESTEMDGTRTYTASSSPMVEIPLPSSDIQDPSRAYQIQQPFLERMRVRQQRWMEYRQDRATQRQGDMQLISVKRQRKLKMKKHKYKKLMKRTRTLRRKLNKA